METDDWDGTERRSGDDRRKTERRKQERRRDGVLSTREGERREIPRRQTDRDVPGSEEISDD